MATIYLTRDGDMLDLICFDHYGPDALNQSVTAVLEANPGLADQGAMFPAGLSITLPDWTPLAVQSAVQLWDL